MKIRNTFEDNSREQHVWLMHHDGKSIAQIAEQKRMEYDDVKEIILKGWRRQG